MRILDFLIKYMVYSLNTKNKRDPNIWVFGEWYGKRTGDNSTFLANYVVENHKDVQAYWFCDPSCDTSDLDDRIKVIDYSSAEAIRLSKQAAVAVMNEGIVDLNTNNYNYFGNALKVNLWHGMMWKKIVNDMKEYSGDTLVNRVRNKVYKYDLFESISEEYTKHIKTGFSIEQSAIVNSGFPRNQLFYDKFAIADNRKKVRAGANIEEDSFVIVYLPTFRDSHSKPFSFSEIQDENFWNWATENKVYFLQKAHEKDTSSFSGERDNVININSFSAQELMAASDMLVTDYSSCFFDYLLMDKPIVHYLYDYDYYRNEDRGVYYDREEVVCGDTPESIDDLIKAIKENYANPELRSDLRKERKEQFMTYESADTCRIITQRIISDLKNRGLTVNTGN